MDSGSKEVYDNLQSLSDMIDAHTNNQNQNQSGVKLGSYKPIDIDDEDIDLEDEELTLLNHETPEQASDTEMNKMIADKYKEIADVDGGIDAIKYAFRKAVDQSKYTPEKNPEMFNDKGVLVGKRGSRVIVPIVIFILLVTIGFSLVHIGGQVRENFYNGDIEDTQIEDNSKLDIYIEHGSELDKIAKETESDK